MGENHERRRGFPGFPARGTSRGQRVRLSSRKAACSSMAPPTSTGNPGSIYTNCETAIAHNSNRLISQCASVSVIGFDGVLESPENFYEHFSAWIRLGSTRSSARKRRSCCVFPGRDNQRPAFSRGEDCGSEMGQASEDFANLRTGGPEYPIRRGICPERIRSHCSGD